MDPTANPQPRFIAVKSRTRLSGYTVQDTTRNFPWPDGPQCTIGQYKYKSQARLRADFFNEAYAKPVGGQQTQTEGK